MSSAQDTWRNLEVNAIFKGGGAKGIAYAGALQALEARQITLRSVAGTSAGAITASLVAAGYTSEELTAVVPDLLASVKRRLGRLVFGFADGIFDNQGLAHQLEQLLWAKVGPGSDPVTFRDLHEATDVSLYVVALDLRLAHPVVFSCHTTPDVSVTGAVIASSAIPAAFSSGRAVWSGAEAPIVGRMVDGGAWANYPLFVYFDESFRSWLERTTGVSLQAERARPTLGFTLGQSPPHGPQRPVQMLSTSSGPSEYDQGTLQDTDATIPWMVGYALSGRLSRLLMAVAVLVASVTFFRLAPSFLERLWLSTALGPTGAGAGVALAVSLAVLLGVGLLAAVSLFVVAFGRPLGDVVVPSARAALAVGTGLAPWYGESPAEPIVHLPIGELATTSFKISPTTITSSISLARETTDQFLDAHDSAMVPVQAFHAPSAASDQVTLPPLTVSQSETGIFAVLCSAVSVVGAGGLLVLGLIDRSYGFVGFGLVWLIVFGFGLAWTAADFHFRTVHGFRTFGTTGKAARPATALLLAAGVVLMGIGGWQAAQSTKQI